MISVERVEAGDDLRPLVDAINGARWDEANDVTPYDAGSLATYLQHQDTVFVACWEQSTSGERVLLGMASGRFEIKPYDEERWLYVDEVDVCADQRRRGAGGAIMRELIELARAHGCTEVWLGTEVDNEPANALYRSLDPDDVGAVVGYTYELDD